MVDPSWEADVIEKQLNDLGAKPVNILLTHAHYDHVDLVPYFVDRYQCKVFMSETEINYYNFSSPNLCSIRSELPFQLGSITIRPVFTPGHTKGGVCYLVDNRLFTGDTLFIEGCGICTVSGGSPEEMFYSLQRLKRIVPKEARVFPGHSYGTPPGQTFEFVIKNNIYLNINELDRFVEFRMRKLTTGTVMNFS